MGHLRSQTLPLAQPTLQAPAHTTWQVAAVQPMLLLEPTVKLHVAPEVQLKLALLPVLIVQVLPALQAPLHELPQVPLQVPELQASEQLAADGSQPIWLNEFPPQAASASATRMDFTTVSLARVHKPDTWRVLSGTETVRLPKTTPLLLANR